MSSKKAFKVSAERRKQVNAWRAKNKKLIKAAKAAKVTLTIYRKRLAKSRKAAKPAAPVAA